MNSSKCFKFLNKGQKTDQQCVLRHKAQMLSKRLTSHYMFLFRDQALESKLAACRNFAKDQAARKNYSKDSTAVINGNANKFSHSLHTTYYDKT